MNFGTVVAGERGEIGLGVLFISHSSRDNAVAIKVCNWLKDKGWDEVFLDLDPEHGLAPGHRWQQELKQAGERCSGVVVLISPNWVASEWCRTEFLVADQLGKKIFPVLVAPTPLGNLLHDLTARFQFADISDPNNEAEGFERLGIGLKRAGLDPKSFPWPPPGDPHRPIYRGLEALEEEDAAIFFGRDALITKALDTMRRMRDGAPERLLVILGASGAGKSSFLRAGLIARLKRDEENFLVLPVIRPEGAALTGTRGLAASLGCQPALLQEPEIISQQFARMRAGVTERLGRIASPRQNERALPPSIVIPVDQAEEFFTAENLEATRVLDLLIGALRSDSNVVIVATIRSDSFDKLQSCQNLAQIPLEPFSLSPIPLGAFKEVIECPARLANPPLTIEPALIDRLLDDLAAEDALPLLALTLERLSSKHPGGGTLTFAEYVNRLGGLQGAILGAVEAAFSEARRDPQMPQTHSELETLARAAFIPCLVHLDGPDAEPRRRVEQLSNLPETTKPLVRHFINQRLIVSNRNIFDGVMTDTVEVTHEAILRQWPALRTWIAEEREALRALDSVRTASAEWQLHRRQDAVGKGRSWLAHRGGRLLEAEELLARLSYATALGKVEREYLAACRQYENEELLRERQALARTRRLQRNIGILITAAAILIVIAGLGIIQLLAGIATSSANALAAGAAKEAEESNYDRSARYALAGVGSARWAPGSGQDNQVELESDLRAAISASSAIAVLRGHEHQVLSASFSPDGKRIVTASRDNTARIWDAQSGQMISVLRGHGAAVMSARFSPDGRLIVTSSDDETARIWDASTATQRLVIRGHEGTVYTAVFSQDGKKILTASSDQTARVWDAATGMPLAILRGHTADVQAADFSRDARYVVTASMDKTARIWDAISGLGISILRGHANIVESAVFSPDGNFVATASDDGTARIWDTRTAQQRCVLQGHDGSVSSVAFSPDGSRVVTGSTDDTIRVWSATSGREQVLLKGHGRAINSVSFSADGQRLVSASDDKTARIWDANAHLVVLRGHDSVLNGVAFSRDGKRVATASSDRTVRIWDTATGNQLAILRGHTGIVESVAFMPDGNRVVSGSDDRTVRLWEISSGRVLAVLRNGNGYVYGVTVSGDGKRIATASTDGFTRLWNSDTGHLLSALRHSSAVNSVEFDAEGRRVVTSSHDGTARIWDTISGRPITVFHGHEGDVFGAAFSPDGRRIVTAGQDRTARIWDAFSGQLLVTLQGHNDPVMAAYFSPDGLRVITASHDKTARIWDARTGSQIAVLGGHQNFVNAVAISFDGKLAVTGSEDLTARIWNISDVVELTGNDLLRLACDKALAHGLSRFSTDEIRAMPVLDEKLDSDACHPPYMWERLGRMLLAGISS